ncbi:hypothetical protein Pla123a_43030 [Posidoniimonas polymericola]|uniref:Uncharacterized protein n=1 Tax=Posidoniimonas polymericola TaxID=2528002 RepID=A0A5C5Y0H4_9BACT|nr:hypothetical protein [Posidoniimonas polymericola]TWT67745.1 hypothetical protein Pla123a_43030 [Posidoniimonas polymericola]
MLTYANIEFAYEQSREGLGYEDQPRRKDYSRNRANRPRRRNQRRVTLGFAGRKLRRGSF